MADLILLTEREMLRLGEMRVIRVVNFYVLQGPPLNGELVNSSHLLIVQHNPRPEWALL